MQNPDASSDPLLEALDAADSISDAQEAVRNILRRIETQISTENTMFSLLPDLTTDDRLVMEKSKERAELWGEYFRKVLGYEVIIRSWGSEWIDLVFEVSTIYNVNYRIVYDTLSAISDVLNQEESVNLLSKSQQLSKQLAEDYSSLYRKLSSLLARLAGDATTDAPAPEGKKKKKRGN